RLSGKEIRIAPRHIRAGCQNAVDAFQLSQTESRVQFAEAVVVADADVPQPGAVRVAPLVAHASAQFSNARIVCGDHAAFARGHLLIRIEGEYTRVAERSGALPVERR